MTTQVNSVFGMDTDGSDGGPFWLHWLTSEVGDLEVKAVYGPIPQASTGNLFQDRVYYTGQYDSGSSGLYRPKVTTRDKATDGAGTNYPYEWLILGVPPPDTPPVVSSTPIPQNGVVFSDGTVVTPPWTVDTGTVTAGDPTMGGACIKMASVAGLHADVGVVNDAGLIKGNLRIGAGAAGVIVRFACDSTGNGPAFKLTAAEFATILFTPSRAQGSYQFGSATAWGATPAYDGSGLFPPTTSGGGFFTQYHGTFNPSTNYPFSISVAKSAASIFTATVTVGGHVFSFDFIPKGSFFGFATSGADFFFDDIVVDDAVISTVASPSTNYVYTWINELGEEGPPSSVSLIVSKDPTLATVISGITDPPRTGHPTDVADYGLTQGDGISTFGMKRLYRAVTGGASTEFEKVADIAYGTTTYTDSLADENLGEVLGSEDYDLPPEDGHSILASPNGITFMASKNEVCPSVQNRPHAYPSDFRLQTDLPIVGMGIIDTNVVVVTQEYPYLVVGSTPDGLSMAKLEVKQGCASRRSFATLKGVGVVYASPDGLVSVSGAGGVQLLTENWLTRRDWQALNPASIIGAVHDDRYFGFYDNGTPGGFIFDPKAGGNGFTLLDLDVQCLFDDSFTDTLQLVIDDELRAWDAAATKLTFLWRSKVFDLSRPTAFSCAQVKADDYSDLVFRYYVDGVLTLERAITSQREFVLPEKEGNTVEIELEGTGVVTMVQVAETMAELN